MLGQAKRTWDLTLSGCPALSALTHWRFYKRQRLHTQQNIMATGSFSSSVRSSICNHVLLGRGGCNRSRENPGIAKKGGGGSDPCQDFFGGFDMVT